MTDQEPIPEGTETSPASPEPSEPVAPADEDQDKLDLAAVAARLSAKSLELEGDAALTPEEPPAEEEPVPEEGGAGEEAPGPDLKLGEHQFSGAEAYAAVEALLFATDRPVTAAQIARALPQGINARDVRRHLKALREEMQGAERGYELREIAGGWQLLTREKFGPFVAKLKKAASARKLSGSALETLAVVAYKQPVGRAEIERIRGVSCGDMLRNLMEKRLVRIAGRSSELGSPLLYGTTADFLDHFGLASLDDLPRSTELGRKTQRAKTQGAKTPGAIIPEKKEEPSAPTPAPEGEGEGVGESESAPPEASGVDEAPSVQEAPAPEGETAGS